jgi:hypothetical protein
MKVKWSYVVLALLLALALVIGYVAVTDPGSTGGSDSSTYLGPVKTTSLIVVSPKTWRRKGKVRRLGHHAKLTQLASKTRALTGPCYRVDAEVHGDSWAIDKVVQGWLHAKICMRAGDHTKIADKYTAYSSSHSESWLWGLDHVDTVTGAGVSTTWCNGGVGPCQSVEYRYFRFVFYWKQGVSVFGQDFAHHKTLYVGCTLRAGAGGYHCGSGDTS